MVKTCHLTRYLLEPEMSQTTSQMPDNLFEDEISLTDIIVRLWKRRGLIVLLPLLCCGATLIWLFTSVTQSRTPTVHFIDLTGIEKSTYPSGAPFSVQDLVAPEVLAHLADRVGLENNSDFREAISVSAYSPSTPGILKKYDQNLSRSNLSTTEIDAINATLTEELARTTERTVRISIDGRSLGLSQVQTEELAILLPESWMQIFTTKYRVLDNTKLESQAILAINQLDQSLGALEASRDVASMEGGVTVLTEDGRLAMLRTATGITPADVQRRLDDFNTVYLSAILSRNLNASDALTQFYVNDIELKILKVDEQINGLKQTISDITDILASQRGSSLSGQRGDSVGLSGNALGDIVSLANQASLSTYLTELFDAQKVLVAERSDLRVQLNKITDAKNLPDDFMNTAQNRYEGIIEEYNALLTRAREMNRQNSSELYHALGAPTLTGEIWPPRAPLYLVLSILIGGFIAVILALILPVRAKDEDGQAAS